MSYEKDDSNNRISIVLITYWQKHKYEFAESFGFSARTLQHWEQGDRSPHGPARVLLLLLQREPIVIAKILRKATSENTRNKAA